MGIANCLLLIALCFVLIAYPKAISTNGAERRKGGRAAHLLAMWSPGATAPGQCAQSLRRALGASVRRIGTAFLFPGVARWRKRHPGWTPGLREGFHPSLVSLGARAPTPSAVGRPPCAPRPGTRLAGCVHQACGLMDLGLLPQASGWTPDPRLLRCARRRPQPAAGARRGFPGAPLPGPAGLRPPTQPSGAGAPSIQRRAAALLDRVCAAPPALVSRRPASAQPPAGVLLGADSWHSGTRPGRPRTAVREKTFGFLWLRPKPLNPVVTYSVFFPITWR
ncbi:hypothetical protein GALL_312040 [mine drainage metagenome]|uniref:Uncharacterized protein n=1 Tax=mine drainage metagenome TaxID=410659 RepID=A0A1J5QTJ4_9ZZZZ